eukprot:332434-Hanusia_phi.AAC.1
MISNCLFPLTVSGIGCPFHCRAAFAGGAGAGGGGGAVDESELCVLDETQLLQYETSVSSLNPPEPQPRLPYFDSLPLPSCPHPLRRSSFYLVVCKPRLRLTPFLILSCAHALRCPSSMAGNLRETAKLRSRKNSVRKGEMRREFTPEISRRQPFLQHRKLRCPKISERRRGGLWWQCRCDKRANFFCSLLSD